MKYDVFISYSRKDMKIADIICEALDKEQISYFIDRKGISGGAKFEGVIAQAISDSSIVLFLGSKDSYVSDNVSREFHFGREEKKTIIPYLIDDSEVPMDYRFKLGILNIRTIKDNPIEPQLVDDILAQLGRERIKKSNPDNTTVLKLYCPSCKTERVGKFCPECGTKLVSKPKEGFCPNCGFEVGNSKFCPECGTKIISTDTPIASKSSTVKDSTPTKISSSSSATVKTSSSATNFTGFVVSDEVACERVKPFVHIGTIGHFGHGKTTLTAAITKCLAEAGFSKEIKSYSQLANPAVENEKGISIKPAHIEYETATRHYAHLDCPNHIDYVKNLVSGAAQLDGAILVVSAIEGAMPQTREHVLLARQSNISGIVVFLNKVDLVDDEDMLDLIEVETRNLLSEYGFNGDNCPVIRGSALGALSGVPEWKDKILELMAAVDKYISLPVRENDKPFLMPIEDIFSIKDRGVVVTGRIETGTIHVNDPVEIVGFVGKPKATKVVGIEMFRKLLPQAEAGDNVGILISGVDKREIKRGEILSAPKAMTSHTYFKAQIYILKKEEGGSQTPFYNNYCPRFFLRKLDISGEITLHSTSSGVKRCMPGDIVEVTVKLSTPTPINKGLRFAVREGSQIVGLGQITSIVT